MKTKWLLGLVVAGLLTGPAGAMEMKDKGGAPAAMPMGQPEANIAVTVNGMVCSFCAQGITKKFMSRPEIKAVDVRLAESRVYLTIRKGEELDDKTIQKVLTDAGYSVEKIERSPS